MEVLALSPGVMGEPRRPVQVQGIWQVAMCPSPFVAALWSGEARAGLVCSGVPARFWLMAELSPRVCAMVARWVRLPWMMLKMAIGRHMWPHFSNHVASVNIIYLKFSIVFTKEILGKGSANCISIRRKTRGKDSLGMNLKHVGPISVCSPGHTAEQNAFSPQPCTYARGMLSSTGSFKTWMCWQKGKLG